MARAGKKSLKRKPETLKKQQKYDRKVRKENQHKLRDAIDRTVAQDEIGIRAAGATPAGLRNSRSAAMKHKADDDDGALLASFDQLRNA